MWWGTRWHFWKVLVYPSYLHFTFYLLSFDFVPLSLPVVVYKAPWWGTRWPYLETASIVSRANCLYLGGIIKIAQHKASIPFIVIRIVTCGPQGRISLQKKYVSLQEESSIYLKGMLYVHRSLVSKNSFNI